MTVGDFQFLLGLLEFSAALNFGFSISEDFRNRPKKEFSKEADNWKSLQRKENHGNGDSTSKAEKAVKDYVNQSLSSGDVLEDGKVSKCFKTGVSLLFCVLAAALLPLPIWQPSETWLLSLYIVLGLIAVYGYWSVWQAYQALLKFWKDELNQLKRTVAVATTQEAEEKISSIIL